jgi:hypothetical protein
VQVLVSLDAHAAMHWAAKLHLDAKISPGLCVAGEEGLTVLHGGLLVWYA